MIAPPIDPGIHDKNSKSLKLLSLAKFATFLSRVAAPVTKIFFSISLVYEKLFPSFITTPLTPLSLKSVFYPAPRIVVFRFFFFASVRNSNSCLLSFAL